MERIECRDCGRVELHDEMTLDRSGWWQAPPPDGAQAGDYGALCQLCAVLRIRGRADTPKPTFHTLGFRLHAPANDRPYLECEAGNLLVRVTPPAYSSVSWVVTTFPADDRERPLSSAVFYYKSDALRHAASLIARALLS